MITIDKKGYIDFTSQGEKIASGVYARHVTLTNFLSYIGVDKELAENDACRIEHIISEETFQCIKEFMEKQS